MSIMGNVVGVPNPRADWAQTDPQKADFIRNKPDLTPLEEGAASAMALAEAALSRAGGQMTGDIDMAGCRIRELPQPQGENDAASKAYVDSRSVSLEVTLTAQGWTGENGSLYTQTVYSPGILETDRPHYGVVYSGDRETRKLQKEGWACVDELDTENDYLVFTCFEEVPAVALTVQLEVHRGTAQ